jgi:hypothetical protein
VRWHKKQSNRQDSIPLLGAPLATEPPNTLLVVLRDNSNPHLGINPHKGGHIQLELEVLPPQDLDLLTKVSIVYF